jgi:quercetin dioxygenase-like cupin family protein
MSTKAKVRSVVMQLSDGPSFWQPLPANGHADPKLIPSNTGFGGASMGYQTISSGGRVREHSHGNQVEFQVCFAGQGLIVIDGDEHPLAPGTACFLASGDKHEIINTGIEDLVMLWLIVPAGLEDFFETIGRPRLKEDTSPEPFARPVSVVALERLYGMNDTK